MYNHNLIPPQILNGGGPFCRSLCHPRLSVLLGAFPYVYLPRRPGLICCDSRGWCYCLADANHVSDFHCKSHLCCTFSASSRSTQVRIPPPPQSYYVILTARPCSAQLHLKFCSYLPTSSIAHKTLCVFTYALTPILEVNIPDL